MGIKEIKDLELLADTLLYKVCIPSKCDNCILYDDKGVCQLVRLLEIIEDEEGEYNDKTNNS